MRAPLLLAVAAAILPLVSACQKPPEKVVVKLEPTTKADYGFSVDMPVPYVERDIPCGKCLYYNTPLGTYKVVVNMFTMAMSNSSSAQARMNRDRMQIQSLQAHAGSYVDALSSRGSKTILLNYKHQGFEDKGSTNIIPSPDGHRRLRTKWADNEIILNDSNPVGEYIIRGYVGENAIYTTSVEGRPEFVNTPEATQFLDSFKIVGSSALPPGKAAP